MRCMREKDLKSLQVEIWALRIILVRSQKKVKSMVEKMSVILENGDPIMTRMLVNMDVKVLSVEGSEGNVEHVIRN